MTRCEHIKEIDRIYIVDKIFDRHEYKKYSAFRKQMIYKGCFKCCQNFQITLGNDHRVKVLEFEKFDEKYIVIVVSENEEFILTKEFEEFYWYTIPIMKELS